MIQDELQDRVKRKDQKQSEVYKACSTAELNSFFDRGWEFVSQYRADETTACKKRAGNYTIAYIRDNKCTVCGDRLEWRQVNKIDAFYIVCMNSEM